MRYLLFIPVIFLAVTVSMDLSAAKRRHEESCVVSKDIQAGDAPEGKRIMRFSSDLTDRLVALVESKNPSLDLVRDLIAGGANPNGEAILDNHYVVHLPDTKSEYYTDQHTDIRESTLHLAVLKFLDDEDTAGNVLELIKTLLENGAYPKAVAHEGQNHVPHTVLTLFFDRRFPYGVVNPDHVDLPENEISFISGLISLLQDNGYDLSDEDIRNLAVCGLQ